VGVKKNRVKCETRKVKGGIMGKFNNKGMHLGSQCHDDSPESSSYVLCEGRGGRWVLKKIG
jgi:hypothetical protein